MITYTSDIINSASTFATWIHFTFEIHSRLQLWLKTGQLLSLTWPNTQDHSTGQYITAQRAHPQVSGQRQIPMPFLCPTTVLFSVAHSCSLVGKHCSKDEHLTRNNSLNHLKTKLISLPLENLFLFYLFVKSSNYQFSNKLNKWTQS